jgi:hypothetical protein
MTQEQRLILEIVDISAVRMECAKCRVGVLLDPAQWPGAPERCPSCADTWALPPAPGDNLTPIQHLGVGLRGLLQQIQTKSGAQLPFRVRLEVQQ